MRSAPNQAILIVNAASRVGAESFDEARAALLQAGVDLIDAIAVDEPSRLDAVIRGAVERAPMVIVGGGDGTISSAIDRFAGSGTVFGLLPLGTANSFARTLGIPLALKDAARIIATGKRKRIDLGCINGDHFANTAVIGLSPMIADDIPGGLKRMLGRAAYLVWAARTAVRFKPFRLKIESDAGTRTLWATEVRIANGRFFGGVELVPEARLEGGEIVVEAVTGKSKLQLAKNWLGALFGLRSGPGEVAQFRAKRFRIETRPRRHVAIDGERAATTPIDVTVAADAVEVMVPAESD